MTATVGTTGRVVASAALGAGALATGVLLIAVGPGTAGARAGLVTVGLLASAVLAWAAVRGGRWLRLGWYAVAGGAALQTLALLGGRPGRTARPGRPRPQGRPLARDRAGRSAFGGD